MTERDYILAMSELMRRIPEERKAEALADIDAAYDMEPRERGDVIQTWLWRLEERWE